jgi:hypothetical protein
LNFHSAKDPSSTAVINVQANINKKVYTLFTRFSHLALNKPWISNSKEGKIRIYPADAVSSFRACQKLTRVSPVLIPSDESRLI